MLVGIRERLIRRRTQLTNSIRGYAAEFGLIAARGLDKIEPLLARIAADAQLPDLAKELFAIAGKEYDQLQMEIRKIATKLMVWHKHNELSQRLAQIPGIGPIGAVLAELGTTLLILDGMEALTRHALSTVGAWLATAPQLMILATSRLPLRLSGELVCAKSAPL